MKVGVMCCVFIDLKLGLSGIIALACVDMIRIIWVQRRPLYYITCSFVQCELLISFTESFDTYAVNCSLYQQKCLVMRAVIIFFESILGTARDQTSSIRPLDEQGSPCAQRTFRAKFSNQNYMRCMI